MWAEKPEVARLVEATLYETSLSPLEAGTISTRLVVGIDEAIGEAPGLQARAAAIFAILDEINESVRWLHQPGTGANELAGLALVVEAARQHATRMARLESIPGHQP